MATVSKAVAFPPQLQKRGLVVTDATNKIQAAGLDKMNNAHSATEAVVINDAESKNARFAAPLGWDTEIWWQNPMFADLAALFQVQNHSDFPTPAELSNWLPDHADVAFVDTILLEQDGRYYEDFIYQRCEIPTRLQNWHDFFGALIWCLFPKTKTLLNQLHMAEIAIHGQKVRSKLRNKLTLFDECGVLVLYQKAALPVIDAVRQHQWQHAFVDNRLLWSGAVSAQQPAQAQLQAMIFGHANYEMATRPFIGLTGKMLAIEVQAEFFDWPLRQRIDFIDTQLSKQITNNDILQQNNQLTPLPILGIPGWYPANQAPSFYQDVSYFRPKRIKK